VLLSPASAEAFKDYTEEYRKVLADYNILHSEAGIREDHVCAYPELGLVVIKDVPPMHYYALFSVSQGMDIVVALYTGYLVSLSYSTKLHDCQTLSSIPRCI